MLYFYFTAKSLNPETINFSQHFCLAAKIKAIIVPYRTPPCLFIHSSNCKKQRGRKEKEKRKTIIKRRLHPRASMKASISRK